MTLFLPRCSRGLLGGLVVLFRFFRLGLVAVRSAVLYVPLSKPLFALFRHGLMLLCFVSILRTTFVNVGLFAGPGYVDP